jgi:hypothetical protein
MIGTLARCALSATCAILLASWSVLSNSKAQPPKYEPVDAVDLMGHSVPDNKSIETSGHFWIDAKGAFFNVDGVSGRPPMRVDLSKIDAETIRKQQADCSFILGCEVVFRGETLGTDRRQVLVAHEVQIKRLPGEPPPPKYDPVNAIDLMQYVPDGKTIETTGHFWMRSDGALFNADRASARPAVRVDLSKCDTETIRKLRTDCTSERFEGGCEVIIRVETKGSRAQQVLIAHDIQIKGKQN